MRGTAFPQRVTGHWTTGSCNGARGSHPVPLPLAIQEHQRIYDRDLPLMAAMGVNAIRIYVLDEVTLTLTPTPTLALTLTPTLTLTLTLTRSTRRSRRAATATLRLMAERSQDRRPSVPGIRCGPCIC